MLLRYQFRICYQFALICFLLSFFSCEKDAWKDERCGPGNAFAKSVEDGPCNRCAVEDGYYTLGKQAQFCYKKLADNHLRRLATFASPLPYVPVDSFIFSIGTGGGQVDPIYKTSGGLNYGIFLNNLAEVWDLGRCDDVDDPAANARTLFCCGFDGLILSPPDTTLSDGTRFYFSMGDFDIDGDCFIDYGEVSGVFQNGVGIGDVYWTPFKPPFGLDTIRHDTLYLHPMPVEMML